MDLEIKKSKYQGYVWYSDRTEPELLDNQEFELKQKATENPFVLEALLYDGEHSIQVKYVDGTYWVRDRCPEKMAAEMISDENSDVVSYLPNRMDLNTRSLLFKRFWKKMPDPMCENMKVLVPQPLVFVGFGKDLRKEN